jgi:hypothetical protein
MVGEYSRVALATVELPCDPAFAQGSIVADATVKPFHAHRGFKPTAKFRRRAAAGRDEQMDKVEGGLSVEIRRICENPWFQTVRQFWGVFLRSLCFNRKVGRESP